MSTPAVNEDMISRVPGSAQQFNPDGTPRGDSYPYGNNVIYRRARQRPASQNNPKDTFGWRSPGGWYNRGWSCNLAPIGSLKVWDPSMTYYTLYWDGAGWDQQGGGFLDPTSSYAPKLEAKAINKALSKLKNQKVNLGQMFTEREETAKLITNTVRRITDLTRTYRNKNWKDWVKAQTIGRPGRGGSFPESFLEYRYGVKPLMEDGYGALEALNQKELSSDGKYLFHVSGRSGQKDSFLYWKSSSISGYLGFMEQCVRTDKVLVSLYYSLENPLMATLAQLGIFNLPSLAWERVPFSFVADWFTNVGPYLGLLDAAVGYQFHSGTISSLARETDVGYFAIRDGAPSWLQASTWLGGTVNYSGHTMNRVVLSSSPLPRWEGFKNPFPQNALHAQNAIALLASLYRSKSRTDYA